MKDGGTVHVPLERVRRVINGVASLGYAYRGSIPGPTLKVRQGQKIKVVFHNNTEVPETIHSHGLRLKDYRSDGSHVSQDPVRPGDSFVYHLDFPDPGLFWYHSHHNDETFRPLGVFGAIEVEPADPNYYSSVNRQEILQLSDIQLDQHGYPTVALGNKPTHVLMGRFGNQMLVNGKTDYQLKVKRGEVVRFQLLNSANARPFNFSIKKPQSGHHMSGDKSVGLHDIKLVGTDLGKFVEESLTNAVLISPAERYTVEAIFDQPGIHQIINKTPDGTTVLGEVFF